MFEELKIFADKPHQRAALNVVIGLADQLEYSNPGVGQPYLDGLFVPLWADPDTDGFKAMQDLQAFCAKDHAAEDPNDYAVKRLTMIVYVITSFAVSALRAEMDVEGGWEAASMAQMFLGVVVGLREASGIRSDLAHFAQAGAAARHRENYQIKAQVFAWCADHLDEFPSAAKAANAVIKLVPVSHATAHKYLLDWRKKNRIL